MYLVVQIKTWIVLKGRTVRLKHEYITNILNIYLGVLARGKTKMGGSGKHK